MSEIAEKRVLLLRLSQLEDTVKDLDRGFPLIKEGLRDKYIRAALQGLASSSSPQIPFDQLGQAAVQLADATIKARNQTSECKDNKNPGM